MSQLSDCKSMLISAERRSNSWENRENNLDLVLETMEIFLDCQSIVEILEEVKAYYLRNTYKEIDTKTRMVKYLDDKIGFYQFNN
jgi:hypothetical protein